MPHSSHATSDDHAALSAEQALEAHRTRRDRFAAQADHAEGTANRISLARLLTFLLAVAIGSAGFTRSEPMLLLVAAGTMLAFAGAVAAHVVWLKRRDGFVARRDINARHVARATGEWKHFVSRGGDLLTPTHDYAHDIDLVGQGSLFQRLDVTRTRPGEQTLAAWLSAPADTRVLEARQQAVRELADRPELRQELEAAAQQASDQKLDALGFRRVVELPLLFDDKPWLRWVIFPLPALTLFCLVTSGFAWMPSAAWLLPVAAQLGLLRFTRHRAGPTLDLVTARSAVAEAYEGMLEVVEQARFESDLLKAAQARMAFDGAPPSTHMRRLKRWLGWSALRTQGLVYLVVNPLVMWDLHMLRGVESWVRDVGRRTPTWFDTLGELEALASFAAFAHVEPGLCWPRIVDGEEPLEADDLGHPLLGFSARVPNDVALRGAGTALLVTGSNMAGKSTLLRAVGVNIALALAGAPVCARRMHVPRVRLRASMRIDDSLQAGASYFQAELQTLHRVVDRAEETPPVFFLLDELLRGTNARARHLGARAVLLHLLRRDATGLVATHDVALSALEEDMPEQVGNVHFTDVLADGEMTFDYRLRPGVVRTSNALRLLKQAGIDVTEEDAAPGAAATAGVGASATRGH